LCFRRCVGALLRSAEQLDELLYDVIGRYPDRFRVLAH
jgi:hypothetical protein